MKKYSFSIALVLALVMFCSCVGYPMSYFSTMLITSCIGDEASMEFATFNGTYNFKLKREGNDEHTLDFEATLEEGEMKVYIGVGGEKQLLRTIKSGEAYNETITLDSKYDNEKAVYVILETVERCKDGEFAFKYN